MCGIGESRSYVAMSCLVDGWRGVVYDGANDTRPRGGVPMPVPDNLNLTPEQRTQLTEALLDAFPRSGDLVGLFSRLGLMVRFRVGASPYWQQGIVADLVQQAETEHWVAHLVATALAERPHNTRVQAVA